MGSSSPVPSSSSGVSDRGEIGKTSSISERNVTDPGRDPPNATRVPLRAERGDGGTAGDGVPLRLPCARDTNGDGGGESEGPSCVEALGSAGGRRLALGGHAPTVAGSRRGPRRAGRGPGGGTGWRRDCSQHGTGGQGTSGSVGKSNQLCLEVEGALDGEVG